MDVYSRRSTAAAQLALHILIFMRTLQSVWIFAARPQPALELPCAVFGRADAIARNEVAIQRHIMPAACKLPPRWRCVTHPRHGCTLARLAGRTTALFQDVPTCCTLLHRASGRVRCFAECWLLAIMCQPLSLHECVPCGSLCQSLSCPDALRHGCSALALQGYMIAAPFTCIGVSAVI